MHIKPTGGKRIIAIVRGLAPSDMRRLAQSLVAGGITRIEVTFAQNRPECWRETCSAIEMLNTHFQGQVEAGAGTVISLEQLRMAHDAGAQYIVSPNVDTNIIQQTKALGMRSYPGAMTPSEIALAYQMGADAVKLFPAGTLGVEYVRAIRAPLSHIPLLAVGGINERNAADFLQAGCAGIGVGGNLVNKMWIANGRWDKIAELAQTYVKAVEEL